MKKCQTVKDISIEDNKTERETNFTRDDQTFTSNKKLSIPIQQLNLNNKIILTNKKYQKRKNISNILTNDNHTISNISLNSNSNNNNDESNNSYRLKIYQKKRIPLPQKGTTISREKDNSISIDVKNNHINHDKNRISKDYKIGGKNENISREHISAIIPKLYKKNKNKKNISICNNDNTNKNTKIKRYLYLNHNMKRINININNQNKAMSDRHFENHKKRVNSNNYKKIDLFQINKINKINNININLNNINNINNKIEYDEIRKNVNSCRNKNTNFDDINFLKRLNFDQPGKYNLVGFNTLSDNNSSNKTLLNNHIQITERIKHNQNYIYKNHYTLNTNSNINTNMLNKKILYKIEPKKINPIILTPRDKIYNISNNLLNGKNKVIYSPDNNSMDFNVKNIKNNLKNNFNNDNDNIMQKNYSMPYKLNNRKNKTINLFDSSLKKNNNVIKKDNINNRINIYINNGNNINVHRNENINININNNFDSNIGTNESLTILNSSISEIASYISSNDLTQIESEKDEKNNVVSSYQLNLYLKEAKKSNRKNIDINHISNNHLKKAFLYVSNASKYITEINDNNNKNKTVDTIDNDSKLFKRNYDNKNSIYDYNTRTYNPLSKKLKLNNILFVSINTNFKLLLIKFLDKKSLLILSSLNKNFYKNFRKKIYKYFYEKIIKNNGNGNKEFVLKILHSIPKYASKILLKSNKKSLKSKYQFYKRNKSIYNDIILQDITRTFPNDPSFKVDSINYNKLYNLLTCYSNYNKSIGYAQGLNFLAASSIFLFKNEEKVFIFLDGLINRFKLNHLLSINNQNLPKKMKYFSQILNKYCNEFISYLSSKLLNHEFFSTSWLLTLFSNSMERSKLFICWCFMVIFGWKFFYSFVIQLLLFYKKNLIEINETKLSVEMKEILRGKQFIKDFNEIIKNTLIFMSNNIVL